ncbi:O-acetyl-ADP-ribose deacetylase [Novipirellula artificiosorum]|nr:O-acetyl-ADP-ribose deacetylase [Novipirellula artificiosorum]
MLKTQIEVQRNDITKLSVDAIVNAANETMLGGGGVDGAIHRAAGPALLQACQAFPQKKPGVRCLTGKACITNGFKLPAKYIIHTVGPIWNGGSYRERELLASCYRQSIVLADALGVSSIAFPAISCGIYGFPLDQAAEVSVRTLREATSSNSGIGTVILVAFDESVAAAWSQYV